MQERASQQVTRSVCPGCGCSCATAQHARSMRPASPRLAIFRETILICARSNLFFAIGFNVGLVFNRRWHQRDRDKPLKIARATSAEEEPPGRRRQPEGAIYEPGHFFVDAATGVQRQYG